MQLMRKSSIILYASHKKSVGKEKLNIVPQFNLQVVTTRTET